VLRHLNYKPWFALAEFVDNSLGSYLAWDPDQRPIKLVVAIDMDLNGDGRITISDNARGISVADFPRAFRAAEVPPDRRGLSEFGMGMKSAASWFARQWTVRTKVASDDVERSVTFDLEQITENRISSLAVREGPSLIGAHYTVVELIGLNHVPQTQTVTKIKSHLTSIYREFIRNGTLELRFRGEPLSYQEVESLVAPKAAEPDSPSLRWIKPINIDLPGNKSVRGFAGVRAVGSTSQAGFALMRRGRLILGSHDEPYRPVEIFGRSNTYTYQRLYGELTLDGFEVSHTKDGFRWEEEEELFHELLDAALRSEPLNLFAQASGYRAKSVVDLVAPVETAATNVAEAVEDHFDTIVADVITNPVAESSVPDDIETVSSTQAIRREIEFELDSGLWIVDLRTTLDVAGTDWLQVGTVIDGVDSSGRRYSRVEISVSLGHPFSRKFLGAGNENSELLVAIGTAFGLALALGKLNGAKSYSIVHHLNVLLRDAFATITDREESRR
jgi:hypothetical protein